MQVIVTVSCDQALLNLCHLSGNCQPAPWRSAGMHLSPDELATALGATTTLPSDVIAMLAHADSKDHVAAVAERARTKELGGVSAVPRA